MDDIQMPSEVISQIISFQILPQNNLEILAQESRQIFDRITWKFWPKKVAKFLIVMKDAPS